MTICIVFSAAGIEREVWDNRESHDSISSDDTILFSRVASVMDSVVLPPIYPNFPTIIAQLKEFNFDRIICVRAERVLYIILVQHSNVRRYQRPW